MAAIFAGGFLGALARVLLLQAAPTCGEQAPTIVGANGADLLVGTPGDVVVVGLGGRDVLVGKGASRLRSPRSRRARGAPP